jgi:hypothetical protein
MIKFHLLLAHVSTGMRRVIVLQSKMAEWICGCEISGKESNHGNERKELKVREPGDYVACHTPN